MSEKKVWGQFCAPLALVGAVAGWGIALTPGPAGAQEADTDEIVVTARRREEVLSNIPETIAAISAEDLTRSGVVSVNELGRQTPNVSLNRRQDNFPNVVIRGIGSYGNVQGVGFYVDEVQNFTDQTMRFEDLERIEILKGPQGVLYGGSNIGGAIRYVGRTPELDDLDGSVRVEAGANGYRDVSASLNAPLGGMFAVRGAAYYSHDDGFVTNINTGNPGDETREYGARVQLLFQPTPQLQSLTTLRYRNLAGGLNAYTRQASVDEPVYQNQLSFDNYGRRETFAFVENLTYDFGGAELTSITSYTRQDHNWHIDGDYRTVNAAEAWITDPRPWEISTQELRLASQGTTSWDWLFGVYATRIENLQSIPSPVVARVGPTTFNPFSDRETVQTDLAAFGTVNFYWGDFTLGTGLRVGRTEYEASIFTLNAVPQTPTLELSTEDAFVLPQVSLSYDLTDDHMVYFNAARGAEPGRASIDTDNPATYDPEFSTQYELGLKGDIFDGQLRYELAAFQIDYSDRQYESRIPSPAGIVEVIDNIGDSRSTGAEASLSFRPDSLDGLQVDASVGYLNARWRNGAVLNSVDLSGDEIPNSPSWTSNFGVTYTTPVFGSLELDLHADASYTGEFLWRAGSTNLANVNPEHWIVNARIALSHPVAGWEFAARIDNMFDEGYYNEFSPGFFQNIPPVCAAACHIGSVGSRRRAYFSASYNF